MSAVGQQRIGNANAAWSTWNTNGVNTDNEVATVTQYKPWVAGRIHKIAAFFGGDTSAVTARVAAWLIAPHIIFKSPQFTCAAGTHAAGGQAWQEQYADIPSSPIGGDAAMVIGWWRNAGGTAVFSVVATGNFQHQTDVSGDIDTFASAVGCGVPYVCGDTGGYLDIVTGDMRTLSNGFFAGTHRARYGRYGR